jgi:hypothetical protein
MDSTIKKPAKLLTKVPKDIMELITAHQEKKKDQCGCRFGFEAALYDLLRIAYPKQNL